MKNHFRKLLIIQNKGVQLSNLYSTIDDKYLILLIFAKSLKRCPNRHLIFGNFGRKPLLLFEGRTLNSTTLTRLSQGHTYFCRIVAVLSDLRIESVACLAQAGGHKKKLLDFTAGCCLRNQNANFQEGVDLQTDQNL